MNQHQYGDGLKVQSGKGFGQALVVSSKQPKAVQPAEAALHYPAAWQERETFLRLRQPDCLKLDSLIKRCLRWFLAGISLVGERHLDRLTPGPLDLTRQFPDSRALPFIGRSHMHSKEPSQGIHGHVNVAALFARVTVVTCARPTLAGRPLAFAHPAGIPGPTESG
ncbi:hypothetical protein OKW33_001511 [Paraburkholderia atlantica]